jgi:hypothetical protein
MSSENSEEMMLLLEELALLKQMDSEESASPADVAITEAQKERARRRKEISEEMQRLAEESNESRAKS